VRFPAGFFEEPDGQPAWSKFHPIKASKTALLMMVRLAEISALSPPARVCDSLVSMVVIGGDAGFKKRAAHSPSMKSFASPFKFAGGRGALLVDQ
jgi:hypothetical protein